jgi:prepilin-type N-terminal cleavage/methylation domain-containing protein/prepilin-type processing-associated H-X9-DG protein
MTRKSGFTLIELLVVIAIIALLMAIIIPALRAAKELASGAVCVSNQRQLSLAWTSYASDHDEHLVGGSNYYTGANATPYRWVERPLFNDTDNPEIHAIPIPTQFTLQYRLNGIRAGKLFAYTGDEDLYHCPGDKNINKAEPDAVFRTYSINGLMNSECFDGRVGNIYSPINDYRSFSLYPGGTPEEVICVVKTNQIQSPGNKYVFVEEDAVQGVFQQVNEGGFALLPNGGGYDWLDNPALWHNDSSTFGFADGHAERHRWQDDDTNIVCQGGNDIDPSNNEDLHWMVRGFVPKR